MPELVLLIAASSVAAANADLATYAIVPINETRIRELRREFDQARQIKERCSWFVSLKLRSPDVTFFPDRSFLFEDGPYGVFGSAVGIDGGVAIVARRESEAPRMSNNEDPLCIIQHDAIWWEAHDGQVQTLLMYETTLAQAWCLVCPPSERLEAFAELTRCYPEQAADWLRAGTIHSDDHSVQVPLPSLSTELLLPLLQHEERSIREAALLRLNTHQQSPAPKRRGAR